MAFMDQFRRQNDLLQMPNQNTQFGMMQSPFGQQQPMQQRGFGMFQSPWQGYNPQPGNMGYNPQPVQPVTPGYNQPQNPTQNPNIGHNNPRFQVGQGSISPEGRGMFPPMGGGGIGWAGGNPNFDESGGGFIQPGDPRWRDPKTGLRQGQPGFNPQATAPHQPYNWFKAMQGG